MKVKVATMYACDFCGKTQDKVSTLVAGPRDVCICNECVVLCAEVIAENTKTEQGEATNERTDHPDR